MKFSNFFYQTINLVNRPLVSKLYQIFYNQVTHYSFWPLRLNVHHLILTALNIILIFVRSQMFIYAYINIHKYLFMTCDRRKIQVQLLQHNTKIVPENSPLRHFPRKNPAQYNFRLIDVSRKLKLITSMKISI